MKTEEAIAEIQSRIDKLDLAIKESAKEGDFYEASHLRAVKEGYSRALSIVKGINK